MTPTCRPIRRRAMAACRPAASRRRRPKRLRKTLMAAENPVAFAAYLGRKPEAVAVFDRLARTCGIRVAEFNAIDLNIPQTRRASPAPIPCPCSSRPISACCWISDVPFVPQ